MTLKRPQSTMTERHSDRTNEPRRPDRTNGRDDSDSERHDHCRGCGAPVDRTAGSTGSIAAHASRRRVLAGVGAVATAALAGCLGDEDGDDGPSEPIALDEGKECDVCGMVIADHFGPAGQVFYDEHPDGRDGPGRFDSVTELVTTLEEATMRGAEVRAVFVTDYSGVEYDLREVDGRTYISTHAAAEDFADATDLHYVAECGVEGAMGSDYLPFADREEAESFASDHDGAVQEWADVDPR